MQVISRKIALQCASLPSTTLRTPASQARVNEDELENSLPSHYVVVPGTVVHVTSSQLTTIVPGYCRVLTVKCDTIALPTETFCTPRHGIVVRRYSFNSIHSFCTGKTPFLLQAECTKKVPVWVLGKKVVVTNRLQFVLTNQIQLYIITGTAIHFY